MSLIDQITSNIIQSPTIPGRLLPALGSMEGRLALLGFSFTTDTAIQKPDSKFAKNTICQSWRLPTKLNLYEWVGGETFFLLVTLISGLVILTLEIVLYFKRKMIPRDPVYKHLLRFGFIKLQLFDKSSPSFV